VDILDGRIAVVTGAASGIGLAVTEAFVAEGMRVAMLDRNDQALQSHARRLAEGGAEVQAVHADVRDAAQLESIGRSIVDRFGGLHVAVNNAGIVNRGTSWELSIDEWRQVLDVNLWGVINGVHAFVPLILATGEEGHVVNTASLAALLPLERLGPYTVAKHGVLGLSDVLRADLVAAGAPVGVSVVMPGLIKTGMNPIGTVPAAAVAANVVDAMRRNRPYVYTDDHATAQVERRLRELIDARAQVVDETGR
jgi:NAD(P)-dependent dehydrogenase (short-subunit alcohol dehydrogenase family)